MKSSVCRDHDHIAFLGVSTQDSGIALSLHFFLSNVNVDVEEFTNLSFLSYERKISLICSSNHDLRGVGWRHGGCGTSWS
jgi:hypothetical protein